MAWLATNGFRSGVDFEQGIYEWLRGSTAVRDGVLRARDGSVDRSQVQKHLNDVFCELVMRLVNDFPEGGAQRFTRMHDFTYGAGVAFVVLDAPTAAPGDVVIEPSLPGAYFALRGLYRRGTPWDWPEVPWVSRERLPVDVGLRWADDAGRIYVTDRSGVAGPLRSYDLSLSYVPAPPPIDIGDPAPRTDIPRELHPVLEVAAALRLATIAESAKVPTLQQQYQHDFNIAAEALSGASKRPLSIKNTRYGRR